MHKRVLSLIFHTMCKRNGLKKLQLKNACVQLTYHFLVYLITHLSLPLSFLSTISFEAQLATVEV